MSTLTMRSGASVKKRTSSLSIASSRTKISTDMSTGCDDAANDRDGPNELILCSCCLLASLVCLLVCWFVPVGFVSLRHLLIGRVSICITVTFTPSITGRAHCLVCGWSSRTFPWTAIVATVVKLSCLFYSAVFMPCVGLVSSVLQCCCNVSRDGPLVLAPVPCHCWFTITTQHLACKISSLRPLTHAPEISAHRPKFDTTFWCQFFVPVHDF